MSKCKVDVNKVREFLLRNGGFSDVDAENIKTDAELIRTEAGCAVVRFEGQKLFPYYVIPCEFVKEDKVGKPEAFCTGGGFWLSAMWLDEDRYTFFRLHNALLREADTLDLSGAWCADIIHEDGANDFPKFAYRGTFYFKSGDEVTAYGVDWQSFCTDVQMKTGIRLPLRKNMKFYKLSSFEQIAGLDAAHIRPNGVHVTADERFGGKGWRASEAIWK